MLSGALVMELQPRLPAQTLEPRRPEAVDRDSGRRATELRQRRPSVLDQSLGVRSPEPGDERDAVVGLEPRVALAAPRTDRATIASPGIGRHGALERLEEP